MPAGLQMADLKIGATYRFQLTHGDMDVMVTGPLEAWYVSTWGSVKVEVGDAAVWFDPATSQWEFTEVTD